MSNINRWSKWKLLRRDPNTFPKFVLQLCDSHTIYFNKLGWEKNWEIDKDNKCIILLVALARGLEYESSISSQDYLR